jgi:predicted CopG family antitoxin
MVKITTIQITREALNNLKSVKEYPRQTYSELILKMAKVLKQAKRTGQYDEFLHRIQQAKIKELWDNQEDEAWENV